MELDISSYCGREIVCGCGRTHFCPIDRVEVSRGALAQLPEMLAGYKRSFWWPTPTPGQSAARLRKSSCPAALPAS